MTMEFLGWITVISLCALAVTFIILELGPVIHTEIISWSIRKGKALEAKEAKAKFKSEMKFLKRQAIKFRYMLKHNLKPSDLSVSTDACEETTCDVQAEEDDKYYQLTIEDLMNEQVTASETSVEDKE